MVSACLPEKTFKKRQERMKEKNKGNCAIGCLILIGLFILVVAIGGNGGKDKPKQTSTLTLEPPISYEVGYTSGMLATISVPKGTTKSQLKELLNYFHSLNQKGDLFKVMDGHTMIDIFDEKKWTEKENYDNITKSKKYCDYIKAAYSLDIDGIESASIGYNECPNYEEVIEYISPTPAPRSHFRANVNFSGTQFVISNLDDLDCQNSQMSINSGIFGGGYVLNGYILEVGKTYKIGALNFAKGDGTRFNPFEIKPKNFNIRCRGTNALDTSSWFGEF